MYKIKIPNKNIIKVTDIVLVFFCGLFFLILFNTASAVDCKSSIDKDKCEELEKKAKAYQDIINIKTKAQIALKNQLSVIDTQQTITQAELSKTRVKTESLAQQINKLNREIKDKENSLRYQQVVLANLMRSYYEYSQGGLLDIILINQNFSEVFNQSDRIEQSSSRVSEVLKNIRDTKAELQEEQRNIQQKKQESDELKDELEKKNLNLQYNENQKQALLGQTQADAEKYKKLLEDIEDEISNLEEGLSASVNMENLPPDKGGYFTWPVNPHILTQGYGKTSFARSSRMYKNNFHNGFDFGIKYSSVFTAKDGRVIGSGDNGKYAYGKWIAIDHGDGLVTLYGHLSSKYVSKGDKVKEGQKIGISGNTGNSTGPHLHFSVFASTSFKTIESSYVDGLMIPTGAPVNPKKYL